MPQDGEASRGSAVYVQFVDPDNNPVTPNAYGIVQWTHMTPWSFSLAPADLNFQARLHQNGDIEFQYGPMGAGGHGGRAMGGSATVGVEDEPGTWGYTSSYNEAAVEPHTGVLFKRVQ